MAENLGYKHTITTEASEATVKLYADVAKVAINSLCRITLKLIDLAIQKSVASQAKSVRKDKSVGSSAKEN